MDRQKAAEICRAELDKAGLNDWSVRIISEYKGRKDFMGKCLTKDKCIVLNGYHLTLHPDAEIIDTIKHEIAHALTPNDNNHGDEWKAKATELGARPQECSPDLYKYDEEVINAIRSGQSVQIEFEEEVIIIRKPKYTINKLEDVCPTCHKVSKNKRINDVTDPKNGDTLRMISYDCFHMQTVRIPAGTPYQTLVSNWWKDEVKNCKHEWPINPKTNKPLNKCKHCKQFRLFEFQVIGARHIEQAIKSGWKGAGVFDDTGLGKTVQTLAYLKYHPDAFPVLQVVKSAIKFNWFKENIRWLGPDHFAQIINTSKDPILPGFKIYIISTAMMNKFPKEKLVAAGIKTIIVDECQHFSNPDSGRTQELRKFASDANIKVLGTSATPWKNKGGEFFPILNMIAPTVFNNHLEYLRDWVKFTVNDKGVKKQGGIKNVVKFREKIAPFVIRREYNEVMDEFPSINRNKLYVELEGMQAKTYNDEVSDFVKWYNGYVLEGKEDSIDGLELLAKINRMRHITGLAKIPATETFVEQFVEECDRSLTIFVHHKDVGSILLSSLKEKYKDEENIVVESLTAEHTDEERFNIAQRYGRNGKQTLLIASTLASGEGVDGLQVGHDALVHERQWNPANEYQAAPGRFRRIGQESSVINITYVEAEGTVDEHMDNIVEFKDGEIHEAMNKGERIAWQSENEVIKGIAAMIAQKFKKDNPKAVLVRQ